MHNKGKGRLSGWFIEREQETANTLCTGKPAHPTINSNRDLLRYVLGSAQVSLWNRSRVRKRFCSCDELALVASWTVMD